ncbi:hypothetical protein HQ308_16895 [Rhodococcus sp. BP-241]|uniref:hypothetical protein n=1 Tax=Rhodococcus sp. BP-241 TaxID=2739441 RepID=UPI001C9A498F|nr:hypothetical protein [Rhodococcus sp. BP-241]MBY6708480.1 hypothetical protein [Rhodococcus sp. BP-241]
MSDDADYMLVGENGVPTGFVDLDQITIDATVLMYQQAAVAGDDDAVDGVVHEFMAGRSADEIGYITAAALSLMTRHIVAPLLDVADQAAPQFNFRAKLVEAWDNAIEALK